MSDVARALEVDETRGFMKAVVDAGTSQILGCATLGIAGGEMMSVLLTGYLRYDFDNPQHPNNKKPKKQERRTHDV